MISLALRRCDSGSDSRTRADVRRRITAAARAGRHCSLLSNVHAWLICPDELLLDVSRDRMIWLWFFLLPHHHLSQKSWTIQSIYKRSSSGLDKSWKLMQSQNGNLYREFFLCKIDKKKKLNKMIWEKINIINKAAWTAIKVWCFPPVADIIWMNLYLFSVIHFFNTMMLWSIIDPRGSNLDSKLQHCFGREKSPLRKV